MPDKLRKTASDRSNCRFSADDRFEQLLQLQIKAVASPGTGFTAVQHFQKLDTARAAKGLLRTVGYLRSQPS